MISIKEKIVPYKNNLIQSFNNGIQMCILDEYTPVTPLFFCKDYFQEFLLASYYEDAACNHRVQYGYHCIGNPKIVDKEIISVYFNAHAYLFVYNKINNEKNWTQAVVKVVSQLDVLAGIPPTTFEVTDDGKGLILNINIRWIEKPAIISLFLLLSRLALAYDTERTQDIIEFIGSFVYTGENGGNILLQDDFRKFLIEVLKDFSKYRELFPTWESFKSVGIEYVHDRSGIFSAFSAAVDLEKSPELSEIV